MSTVIKVENIGKKYVLRHEQAERYKTFAGVLTNIMKVSEKSTSEEFWALNDVSFDVQQGDRVGIIGRNGAGKSTLLKVLSRIVTPTKGRIEINGRVSSLLEVGTGFHPELSGRENIYLNGSILGMNTKEIDRKFDEIVAFAEVEKFLDTPVKRYSSGMYVRLAFAVAAHLEPEILIIDEVLAVGDSKFQKKCIGKMEEVSESGKTLLFVSHNMGIVKQLCNKGVYLKNGTVAMVGPS
ncbi:MAG: ABC transporter ATP-binding protein, partial [Bacteroidia bacterium]